MTTQLTVPQICVHVECLAVPCRTHDGHAGQTETGNRNRPPEPDPEPDHARAEASGSIGYSAGHESIAYPPTSAYALQRYAM